MVASDLQLGRLWSDPENREKFLNQLYDRGYDQDRLNDIRRLVDAPHSDLFDVLSYILFTHDPKTRYERADRVRGGGLSQSQEMRSFLMGILASYEANGETELGVKKLGDFIVARYGTFADAKSILGEMKTIKQAYIDVQRNLYSQ